MSEYQGVIHVDKAGLPSWPRPGDLADFLRERGGLWASPNEVRRVAAVDLPWVIETAIQKYQPFDANAALLWGEAHINNPDVAILRTQDTWCVAVCGERFYAPGKLQAEVLLVCSAREDRRSASQLLALVRAIHAWAIERGCWRLDFAAETTRCDLGPLVRRLGSARQHSSYMLELPTKGE